MVIALQKWGTGTFLMGVAIAETNQPWLVNIGILYHLDILTRLLIIS